MSRAGKRRVPSAEILAAERRQRMERTLGLVRAAAWAGLPTPATIDLAAEIGVDRRIMQGYLSELARDGRMAPCRDEDGAVFWRMPDGAETAPVRPHAGSPLPGSDEALARSAGQPLSTAESPPAARKRALCEREALISAIHARHGGYGRENLVISCRTKWPGALPLEARPGTAAQQCVEAA